MTDSRFLSKLLTPDGRYIIVRGRLWRASNPDLSAERKEGLVSQLMEARRQVKTALAAEDPAREIRAEIQDLRPLDMIDIQSFMWVLGSADFD